MKSVANAYFHIYGRLLWTYEYTLSEEPSLGDASRVGKTYATTLQPPLQSLLCHAGRRIGDQPDLRHEREAQK